MRKGEVEEEEIWEGLGNKGWDTVGGEVRGGEDKGGELQKPFL